MASQTSLEGMSLRWDRGSEGTVSRAIPFIQQAKLLQVDRRDDELTVSRLVVLPELHLLEELWTLLPFSLIRGGSDHL
jgi:hypothetical protein